MGIACDDFDNDGWLDLYVTNFFQDYNTFYLNQQNLTFVDHTSALRLVNPTMRMLGFGTQSVDLDLDGYGEIIVANGHIYDRRFEGTPWQMRPHCFRRLQRGTYQDIADEIGPYFRGEYIGRGVARLDFNHDFLPDAVVVHQDRPAALLVNNPEHWTSNRPEAARSSIKSRSARTESNSASVTQARMIEVTGGDGYCTVERTDIDHRCRQGSHRSSDHSSLAQRACRQLVDVPTNTNLLLVESRLPIVLPVHAER